ncbi:MAG: DNA topoisomerase [Tissierellia bacterium]|nr:toprim domain-containing protein [Bacillota bacterium]NLL23325.1 DNA topoisomerase [Tissierellia bacterium]
MQKTTYTDESIQALKGAQRVRLRPAVIFGSDGLEGCKHSVFEILSNSIDEAREGFGKTIRVIQHADHSITIEDEGRGIPVGYNRKEKRHNWELIFTELYAGGKYENNKGSNYSYSLGLNGLGLTATQYSSEYMDVDIYRDNRHYQLRFEKGENVGGLKSRKSTNNGATGTRITWRPDIDVFTQIAIEPEHFHELLKEQAIVNSGVRFVFVDEAAQETTEYYYENGLRDYIEEVAKGKSFTPTFVLKDEGKGRDRKDRPEYRVQYELIFAFNNEHRMLKYFHNSSHLSNGGSPDLAIKTAFIYEMDRFLKSENKYKKGEGMINFVDIQDSLILICSSFSTVTSYENQTKKSINNNFIREFITDSVRRKLEEIFTENPDVLQAVLDQVLLNKRSRERADIARTTLRRQSRTKNDLLSKVDKFVDCRERDPDKRELFIVEGDSALGACKLARDAKFQALMPIRGKILNTLKSDPERILKSDIIMDLMKVIGTGIQMKTKKGNHPGTFNIDRLRYGKIIITTDADFDGYHIRTMVLTMFYSLAPDLLKEGYVYIAESPLYEIVSKGKSHFAYTERDKNELLAELDDPKAKIHRSKGLGENEPQMLWETTMNPKTRRLIQVQYNEEEEAHYTFHAYLGDNIEERKRLIEEKGALYLDLLDLS